MRRSRIKTNILTGLMLGTIGVVAPIWAQSSQTGGVQLRFGLGLGFETQTNRALDPANPGSTVDAVANLSFGLLTETRTQSLALNFGATLRNRNGSGVTGLENGFTRPSASLSYSRSSASARLRLNASLSEVDLADNGNLVFDEETGLFTIVNGTATQRKSTLGARLNWGDDAPAGFGVSAQLSETSYRGGVATGVGGATLNDSERLTLGATARLDLNEASRLNIALSYSTFEQVGTPGSRETLSLSNSLVIDQPDGNTSFTFGITHTEDGDRFNTGIGRSYEMPLGTLSGQLGVTRGTTGETFLNGSLNATRALPRGNLSFGLARSVTSGIEQDNELVNTSLRFGYLQELSPLANLNFAVNWADAQANATGLGTTNATFTATYSRELTKDWNMDVGYRHRYRDDDTAGVARSNELFFNMRREFLTRF